MASALHNGRATIDTFGNQLQIRIPAKKRIFTTLFMCAWLGGWFFGEISALQQVLTGNANGFIIFWLAAWTLGGCAAIFSVLWNLAGSETITAGGGFLQIKKAILGIGFSREYNLSSVDNFRIVAQEKSYFRRKELDFNSGPIFFDYGMKTVKFGLNIDEAEARHILKLFQEKGFGTEINTQM